MLRTPRRTFPTDDRPRIDRQAIHEIARLMAFVRPYRTYLATATFGTLIASGLGLVFPRIVGDLVDQSISNATGTAELDRVALLLLAVFAAQSAFNFLRSYYINLTGEGVVADLRKAVYGKVMWLPVRFFDSRKTGEITSRLTSDVSVVQTTVSQSVAQTLAQGVTLVGGIGLMLSISLSLSLAVLSFLPIAIVTAATFGRRLRRISTDFQDRVAEANSYAEESISANRVVKWFTAEQTETDRYSSAVSASYDVARHRAKLRAIFVSIVTFVAFGTLAVVVWLGGRQVLAGALTGGQLISFLLYTLTVAGAIGTFTGLYSQLQEALGASRRIFELLEEPNEITDVDVPTPLPTVAGRLTFDKVSFSYTDRNVDVLTDIDLVAEPGQRLAIVGPSGAGKSTLVQLVPRFYDPTGGGILIDGIDIRQVAVADLRRHMAAVPQETQLFSGTIADNLRIGKHDATDAELKEAAVAAHADEFITLFPDGYQTIVGERGVKLSGGQRQRVAIARALLKDPRILVLDEATSSLDSESEALVQEALETLMEGRTTLVIAHRLSTIRDADRIVVVDDGRIVEHGSHDELLARNGLYARLYAAQFDEPLDLFAGDDS
ncbi:MAG: ABC transporter transmembrane domain-containing protein [Acidimicrobiia bacterium]|nr:ABC transporter transmembrane domain-containing protein [Acidimicrobiia bacterium]MDH5421706.1 ABC transporter transmembrane domain-containing protein [Acidimicrobiia bacterium]MDH5504397.1 ABC transporter transmembrane domain-containing protein [Acidimicrobiia bacterium]